MNYKKAILMNQEGAVLVYVLMLFSVIFILATSLLSIFSSNLKQAKYQENNMEAYYLSYSGALMAFAAISEDHNELLYKIVNNNEVRTETNIKIDSYSDNTIDVKAIKSIDPEYLGWVEITSIGTLGSSGRSAKAILYIDPSNTKNIKWKAF